MIKFSCPVCEDDPPDALFDPKVGDYVVCPNCASYLVVGPGFVIRVMTGDEVLDLPNEALLGMTQVRRNHG
jgi:hypothetical protein